MDKLEIKESIIVAGAILALGITTERMIDNIICSNKALRCSVNIQDMIIKAQDKQIKELSKKSSN